MTSYARVPTADLEREAARLHFCLIMMELGSREMFNTVLDPRESGD
jgi:hypothetical protein